MQHHNTSRGSACGLLILALLVLYLPCCSSTNGTMLRTRHLRLMLSQALYPTGETLQDNSACLLPLSSMMRACAQSRRSPATVTHTSSTL